MYNAYAAKQSHGVLEPFQFDPGPLGPEEVEIKVQSCGICHSDLSMLDNEWQISSYPFVPGHELVGTVHALGDRVKRLALGQTVGLGWYSRSCMECAQCMSGDHNLCTQVQATIIGRYGGFADYVRGHSAWVLPVPPGVDAASAGPLFCGGITVFNPIVQFDIRPTHRVGVIGIGGLGHMAIRFLKAWGCEVTAFSSSADKETEARGLGAHHFVNSRDAGQLKKAAGSLDFILSTVNANLEWGTYIDALAPRGRLHVVGAVPEPIPVTAFGLLFGQKSVSGSPMGSPVTLAAMLDFCARHQIAPVTETFPFSQVNDAMDRLRSGKARYRVVLDMAR
jgi:alcohol/geraniol dehydrogenase (NADP+)